MRDIHLASVLVLAGYGLVILGAGASLLIGVDGLLVAGITVLALGMLLALGVGASAVLASLARELRLRRLAREIRRQVRETRIPREHL